MKWRVVLSSDGRGYLVHVDGEDQAEAERNAKAKVRRDPRAMEVRLVRKPERMVI